MRSARRYKTAGSSMIRRDTAGGDKTLDATGKWQERRKGRPQGAMCYV